MNLRSIKPAVLAFLPPQRPIFCRIYFKDQHSDITYTIKKFGKFEEIGAIQWKVFVSDSTHTDTDRQSNADCFLVKTVNSLRSFNYIKQYA